MVAELQTWQYRVGLPPPGEALPRSAPWWSVSAGLSYLSRNAERMAYPRYRQQGLPITSSLAESLVGEFNACMKSRQKYWTRPDSAEAILQWRAAVLSEDGRWDRYFGERPGSPHRRRAKRAQPAESELFRAKLWMTTCPGSTRRLWQQRFRTLQ